ncbi:MAG: glutamyl/glutaminyl-tRNA synthetase, partial [Candidatus Magasanikbacteria bacterium]|nr:glutamyl/glutaminyl-tRNA synthetase [Candidatus Magasanikbacteria bacterium]
PKHILLYEAFGWKPPEFAHLPLLLNADRSKLSKRQGDVAVEEFLKKGYLPDALINFVALLGWNPSADREMFNLKELITTFELSKINKSGAIFNLEKLDWLNGQYIKRLPIGKLVDASIPFLVEKKLLEKKGRTLYLAANGEKVTLPWLSKIVALERERMKKLSDIGGDSYFFFQDLPPYESALLVWKKSTHDETKKILGVLVEKLETLKIGEWTEEKLERHIRKLVGEQKLGVGDVLWPLRTALTGAITSPPPFVVAEILGRKKTMERLRHAVGVLSVI